jgi:ribonuclease P protein component
VAGTATRSRRLSRSADFDAVYRRGRSASSRHLVVYAFARDPGATPSEPRIGLTVSRKVGGAVERNRVKRLLREAAARVTPGLAADVDLVIVARPGLAEALAEEKLDWLEAELRELASRASGTPA